LILKSEKDCIDLWSACKFKLKPYVAT